MAYPEKDYFLTMLLEIMTRAEFSFDLTLTLSGLLVSGTPVTSAMYYEQLGNDLSEGWKNSRLPGGEPSDAFVSVGDVWRELLTERGTAARESEKQLAERLAEWEKAHQDDTLLTREERSEYEQLTRLFIYLKNATIFGAGPAPITVSLWRGRVSEVLGWSLGRLSQTAPR